jgi:hypothetical protein
MSDRHAGDESGEGSAQRTRRIALDDDEPGRFFEFPLERRSHRTDMSMWVSLTLAEEPTGAESVQPKFARGELGMLSGEDKRWP